eukprot:7406426-Pyramimonas_sp.AAC.1
MRITNTNNTNANPTTNTYSSSSAMYDYEQCQELYGSSPTSMHFVSNGNRSPLIVILTSTGNMTIQGIASCA